MFQLVVEPIYLSTIMRWTFDKFNIMSIMYAMKFHDNTYCYCYPKKHI
jgi:hypothetical protein